MLAPAGTEDQDVHARCACRLTGPLKLNAIRRVGASHGCDLRARKQTSHPQMPEARSSLNNVVEWTVSELSAALKRTVEDAFGYVRVRGELSGFKGPSPSGHVYFRLKDDKAVLDGVIWKGVYGRMRVKPEDGLDVIVTGKLTTFPAPRNTRSSSTRWSPPASAR